MNKSSFRRLSAALVVLLLSALQFAHGQTADAAGGDRDLSHPDRVVTVTREGYTISGLVTRLREAKAFKHGVALYPGYRGIMRLREENGQPRFGLGGNFHWTFVGTSEGSVSAFHAARMNRALARRVILTSFLFRPTRIGPGLSWANWEGLAAPLLWVHHENDPCEYTPHREAQRFAERSHSPLVTVRGGGPWRGNACEAFSAHGFAGIEAETVAAMRSWVNTGATPRDVGR